jgi:ferrochelatase
VQISSITDIINGELLNSPAISFIYGVKTHVKKVQEADLFFVKNEKDIPLAIQQGAYAIVCEKTVRIMDDEIAWILVDSIEKSMIRYLRYKLSLHQLMAYCCSEVTFELLNVLKHNVKHQNIKLLTSNLEKNFQFLESIEDNQTIICANESLLKSLYPNYQLFPSIELNIDNLTVHSLFETSFSFKDHYFSHLRLCSLYIQEFLEVFVFLQKEIQQTQLKKLSLFKPLFIDKFYNAVEFGKSDRFLLIQENISLVQKELDYINKYYKYAKLIVFMNETIHLELPHTTIIKINNIEQIIAYLKEHSFNAAYIIGFQNTQIESIFYNNQSTQALI